MRKRLMFFLLFGATSLCLKAQKPVEIGLYIGLSNYLGDLAEQVSVQETHPAYGAFIRWNPMKKLGIKTSIIAGKLSGDDVYSPRLSKRAFSFEAPFWSANLQFEILPFAKRKDLNPFKFKRSIQPYLVAGIGHTSAKENLDYSESPVEAFRIPFPEPENKAAFFNTSFGAGVRFDTWEYWTISLEGSWWYVYSDYLDGVSVNGRSNRNDWYLLGVAAISHHFGGRTICPSF